MDGTEDRFSRGVAAGAVVLLHGLFIAALMPSLRLGYVVIPRSQANLVAVTDPPVAMVASFFTSSDPVGATSRYLAKDPAEGALRDVQAEVVQPRDIRLPDEQSSAPAARSIASESGEVRVVCEVHIHQGSAGAVQAVDFGVCTGDLQWQRSLLHSIQEAARLVSPIREGEFPPVRTLIMDTASPSAEVLARQLSEPIARR